MSISYWDLFEAPYTHSIAPYSYSTFLFYELWKVLKTRPG